MELSPDYYSNRNIHQGSNIFIKFQNLENLTHSGRFIEYKPTLLCAGKLKEASPEAKFLTRSATVS